MRQGWVLPALGHSSCCTCSPPRLTAPRLQIVHVEQAKERECAQESERKRNRATEREKERMRERERERELAHASERARERERESE